ncbi:MAG: host attachment protein [Burkholderiales bacterium]
MARMWIIAADSTTCRILVADSPSAALEEIEVLEHPEGRMHERDLVSDQPGRAFDSFGAGRHAMEVQVSPKQHEAMLFAGRIAARLEAARVKHDFDTLSIVAAPRFLGLLRDKLNPHLRALVRYEVDKNPRRLKADAIRKQLPQRLFRAG